MVRKEELKYIKEIYTIVYMNIQRLLVYNLTKRYYHSKVLDHYENPRNVGKLNTQDPQVGTGLVGAPACGDVMKLQIQVENDIIIDSIIVPI